nr:CBS domain-containing protein [Eggerthella sinensis]
MNRTIGDIMERDVYTCRYDQNLGEVVALFNEYGTSGLAVIDEERHVVGFISDGDIMKAVAAQKTRSIFGGGYANMVLYDNESSRRRPARSSIATSWSWPCRRCCAPRPTSRWARSPTCWRRRSSRRCRSSTRTAGLSAW